MGTMEVSHPILVMNFCTGVEGLVTGEHSGAGSDKLHRFLLLLW